MIEKCGIAPYLGTVYRYVYVSSGMLGTICNLQLSNDIDFLTITLLPPLSTHFTQSDMVWQHYGCILRGGSRDRNTNLTLHIMELLIASGSSPIYTFSGNMHIKQTQNS